MHAALVIMAAGIGSRYGGSKQTDGVGPHGEILMEYGVYDAVRAGFDKVVFIIKPDMRELMERLCGNMASRLHTADGRPVEVRYAYQDDTTLPAWYTKPAGRTKPFGTAHAVLCAKELIHGPFCVVNADDFYGADAFRQAYDFLSQPHAATEHAMVGYAVENTLTENGSVSRGVCETDARGRLTSITERTYIVPRPGGAAFSEDKGQSFTFIPAGTVVSMNLWCFQHSMLDEISHRFSAFLRENLPVNPLKCEYYLPSVPNQCIQEGKATVQVLHTPEKWFGMTSHEDLEMVRGAIEEMKAAGKYPDDLWR